MSRRAFAAGLGAAVSAGAAGPSVGLSFGTYGLRMLTWEDALELIARTGYDGVELALLPTWPTAPGQLSGAERLGIRHRLADLGLALPAVLENLQTLGPVEDAGRTLERLRQAIGLGAELAPGAPPAVETVLGGRPEDWDAVKHRLVSEVGEWARVAEAGGSVICFKPHVGDAVNDVVRSLWLVEQVGSPAFRCTYDYSHLWLAGHELIESLDALLPVSAYIHLKDAARTSSGRRFLLPGDGATDYPAMFRHVRSRGWAGWANVEVSAQIHTQPGYEPIATARLCYERMAAAFDAAGLVRP